RVAERDPGLLDGVPPVAGLAAATRPERARFPHRQPAAARLVAQDLPGKQTANVLEMRPARERGVPLEDLEDADQVERSPGDPCQRAETAAEQEPAVDHDVVERERAGPLRCQVPRARSRAHGGDVALARRLELELVGLESAG